MITWSVVVDPRNVVHALSISLVNLIGDGTVTLKSTTLVCMRSSNV